jgi:hypothetical protein
MKRDSIITFLFICMIVSCAFNVQARDTTRVQPAEWDNLAHGGSFVDRFLPMPITGILTSDAWGCADVLPRDILNGIEHPDWSYWGGRFFQAEDGTYNSLICRWPENHPKGHMGYPYSEIVRVVSDNPIGPYKPVGPVVGPGHNPEFFRLKDGRYAIYSVETDREDKSLKDFYYYISNVLDGSWGKEKFEFDLRGRQKLRRMVNMSFVQREDGTYIAMQRGGDIWFSKTGISTIMRISNKSAYPAVEGKFEDPVMWKTNIQFHMIVNDWLGRIAYYLRSKDGIRWKVEPGVAYEPGISEYEDGTVVNWYKYERIRMLQDDYGRAVQANFAVIDSSKHHDLPNDHHSSKNISIPLTKGKLIEVLNAERIDAKTQEIKLNVFAEDDFNPHSDIDLNSLRLGASELVNYGKGCRIIDTERDGKHLVITFEGKGNGLTEDNFAVKLIGKTRDGKLLFGYARLPGVEYIEPILSARKPVLSGGNKSNIVFEIQNFGMASSEPSAVKLAFESDGNIIELNGGIPALKPYEKAQVEIPNSVITRGQKGMVRIYTKSRKGMLLWEEDVAW